MKKTYQNPEIQLYAMEETDVIATSQLTLYVGELTEGKDVVTW